ncbi:hypothetical protein K1W69_13920 [Hoeflea sp. WL0058]|uniref:Carrier domain-containing protein n=1 Tax=Flavimaribacter sediminis TaxID=2865987 RepID=A0AAE3D0Y8_9HYPH|nr:thioesterase domain-containing protein [Flavimaribacter sediminis]MBW8638289.1 hypothetical protein [Flavimaribacter sediminis]
MTAPSPHTKRETLMLDTPYVAPEGERETAIAEIWSAAFGIADLGVEDDFFDLGGDSVIAETITRQIGEMLKINLKAGALVEARTVRDIAELLDNASGNSLPSHLVPLRSGGGRTPIFIVHGAAGLLFPSAAFMDGFHADQPIYAFQVPGYDGHFEPLDSVEEIATEYLRCMRMVSQDGPWHLAGFCHGSWIAFEMAIQLAEEGRKPLSLTLLDPGVQEGQMLNDYMRFTRRRGKNGLATAIAELKFGAKSMLDAWRCWRATGHWIAPSDPRCFDIPEVWDYLQKRNRERQARALNKAGSNATEQELTERQWMWDREGEGAFDTEKELELQRTDAANEAISRLKRAWYKYGPHTPLQSRVHMVASEFQNEKLKNPAYPIRRLMPDLVITVLGKYHNDTVSTKGPENARIIQRIADDA